MKIDLLPMPYTHARELINYCVEKGIDRDNATRLLAVFTKRGGPLQSDNWVLDVPDSLMTYFALKWIK
jgi:hypothetical protein